MNVDDSKVLWYHYAMMAYCLPFWTKGQKIVLRRRPTRGVKMRECPSPFQTVE
jgi:hypothetical protein